MVVDGVEGGKGWERVRFEPMRKTRFRKLRVVVSPQSNLRLFSRDGRRSLCLDLSSETGSVAGGFFLTASMAVMAAWWVSFICSLVS